MDNNEQNNNGLNNGDIGSSDINNSNTSTSAGGDYSAPESYDADAQYGFSSGKTSGESTGGGTQDPYGQQTQNANGYNLNGQYYANSSGSYNAGSGENSGGYQYGSGNYSNGANNGMNNGMGFGQPPLDKKGRPIPNNFGMKLTFAIIEVLFAFWVSFKGSACIGVAPLVVSVIALVFVCLQNSEYKAGNWDGFVSRRKVSNILLWVAFGLLMVYVLLVLLAVILILVGVNTALSSYIQNSGVDLDDLRDSDGYYYDQDQLEDDIDKLLDDLDDDDDDDDWDDDDHDDDGHDDDHPAPSGAVQDLDGGYVPDVGGFEKFTLGGERMSLPVSCRDFQAAGYKLGSDADGYLEAGASYGYSYSDAEGEYCGVAFVFNTTDKKIKVSDGVIGGLNIKNRGKDDLEMVGGLNFSSTLEDCVQVLGSSVTEEEVGDEYNSYAWWFEKGGYFTSMEFEFDERGEVNEVWIMNTLDLR